ncbi:MAG: hydrogenase nickel incorporation protein HypB [bacterium]
MCDECGCGQADGKQHDRDHNHDHTPRVLEIQRNVRAANDAFAEKNRGWLREHGNVMVNLISSPGAGKTTLLEHTLRSLAPTHSLAVIEGDQQTDNDARRISKTGVAVVQINTGASCHLNAHQVGHALQDLSPAQGTLIFVENVGNLICPAGFDLGQHADVTVLSVTEGDDKPEKYPEAFRSARAVVLSKIDLLPHVDFDTARCERFARALNPELPIFHLSAKTGDGLDPWLDWLRRLSSAEPAPGEDNEK